MYSNIRTYLHGYFLLRPQSSNSLVTSHHVEEFIILFADDQLPSKAYVIATVLVQGAFWSPPHTHRAEAEDLARENSCTMDPCILDYFLSLSQMKGIIVYVDPPMLLDAYTYIHNIHT